MKPTNRIKRKMCQMVGVDWKTVDFENQEDPYYWKHTWTSEQEKEFIEWLADYLYLSVAARNEFRHPIRKTKKDCHNAAYWFTWNHGWKTIAESTEK